MAESTVVHAEEREITITRIQLEDESGKTRLTLTDGPYPEAGGRWAGAGWNGAFDKLAVDLAAKN